MARRPAGMKPSKEPEEAGESSESQRPQKKYNRHNPQQIVYLEETFKGCPHPDETQREALSRQLGMEPRQIKFWFQNRRTQEKTMNEREDTIYLREVNDKIRCENITMQQALKKIHCPQCGVQPVEDDDGFDAQKLRMENDRLREELEHVSNVTSKHLGRPFTLLEPTSATVSAPSSSLNLSVRGMSGGSGVGDMSGGPPGLEFDHLGAGSSAGAAGMGPSAVLPFQMPAPLTNMERPMMMRTAAQAMDELTQIAQAGEHLWIRGDERDTLIVATYDGLFSNTSAGFRPPDIRVEGSRVGSMVFMSAVALVDVFMDTNKWMEFFPGIVSNAQTVDVLVNGMSGRDESLIMVHEEMHILTPVVPTREFTFLRYCKQMDRGLWVVADVSVDGAPYGIPPSRSRRLPSGCLISDSGNGYSQVIWVEHVEVAQTLPINMLYQAPVQSGGAFGAHRWVGALQRACDRFSSFSTLGLLHPDPYGVTPEGNRSMMKLSQRMVNSFCASLASSPRQQWTTLSGAIDVSVRVSGHPTSADLGQNNVIVLSGAASIWLPVPGDVVYAFVRDETMRSFGWNFPGQDNQVQELLHIANGSDPGNFITLLSGVNSSNGQLILQESFTDLSGSLVVVYSPIDFASVNMVVSGEDPSVIPLLPSGFSILPDGSSVPPACVLTVAHQMVVNSPPSCSLSAEYVNNINNLVTSTVQQVRAAFNYAGGL